MSGVVSDQRDLLPALIRTAVRVLGIDRVRMAQVSVPSSSSFLRWGRALSGRNREPRRVETMLEIASLAAKRLGLDLDAPVQYRFLRLSGRAGQIQKRQGVWFIDLDESVSHDPQRLAATIAHEMAHMLLGIRAVSFGGHDDQELLTDTIAALAGFGRIMLAACERTEVIPLVVVTIQKESRIGYLSKQSLRRVLKFHRRVSSSEPYRLWGGVLAGAPWVVCAGCCQQLRFPRDRRELQVQCPTCGVRQRFKVLARRSLVQQVGTTLDEWRAL